MVVFHVSTFILQLHLASGYDYYPLCAKKQTQHNMDGSARSKIRGEANWDCQYMDENQFFHRLVPIGALDLKLRNNTQHSSAAGLVFYNNVEIMNYC